MSMDDTDVDCSGNLLMFYVRAAAVVLVVRLSFMFCVTAVLQREGESEDSWLYSAHVTGHVRRYANSDQFLGES